MRFNGIYNFLDKNHLLSRLFQINIALWFLRMVLSGVKYIFIPSIFVFIVYILIFYREIIFNRSFYYEFLKIFNPLIILGVLFVIALFTSDHIHTIVVKDLFEYFINFVFLIVFFTLTYKLQNRNGVRYVFHKITRIIWVSAFFVALLGLFKYYLQIENIQLPISTPYGTSFNSDKNFFALFSMLGIIGLTTQLIKSDTVKSNIMSQLVLLVLTLNILFANSFRSILLLVILLLLLLITQFFYKHRKIAVLSKRVRFFTAVYLFVVVGFVYGFKSGNQNIIRYVDIYWNDISNGGEISTDNISNKVFNLDKWNYALELYKNQSIIEKVFGGGFDYLDKFGLEYNKTTEQIEYPHNPILSGLLYSGMVGGILIMFFMLVSLYYGGKYLVRYPLFALMLFTSMLFVLFSGNSLFSVPIFLFLFSISFLIRYQEISEMINIVNIDKPGAKFIKDLFDYVLASIMLVLLLPVLIVITIVIGLTMGWPIVFSQIRIGQNAKPFRLYKFRSMKKIKNKSTTVAAVEQNRVTAFGRFLRRYKLDELPELWNIIRGDMSFVGPRPDVVGYADKLKADDRVILQLKPGLTGAASLKYMHEEDVLQKQKDPQKYNDEIIFPDKVIVNKKYMKNWSLLLDLKIIIFTAMGKSMHEDEFL